MDGTQLLKGILPTIVLATIYDGDVYGYRILQRLRDAGLTEVGDASVYGTLQRLYVTGLVSSHMDASGAGPARKCYSLTGGGMAALKSGRETWTSFQGAVHALVNADQEPMR
jgi:PadR family transcriptional regulator, regulatory protein PadR